MANRRHSGPNRSFSGSSMSVNPWQGGAPPTVGGISQLTDSQAQLALALTNLLRPPTLPSSQQQLPSLLNLPQINPGASYNYQRHNYDRNIRSNSNRRGRFGDNKMPNRPSRDRRRNEQRKSDSRNNDSNKNNQKDSEKSLSKSRESDNKNDSDVSKTDNQSEEQEDKKRDWKEEKNNGECNDLDKTQDEEKDKNDENESKDKDTEKENAENKDEKAGDDKEKKDEKKRNKDGRYAGIPVQYLKCLICEKSMWDGESFEKHLRGRAHQQMCESLEDSYKIQADMMRQSIRLAEERKAIELNRMKRHGKRVDLRKVSHCNMCNFDFYGREAEHRRSEGHKKLKRFLHPRCKRCRIEFPTKIEWEEHRLTPEHIRKTMEIIENMGDSASIEVDSSDDIIDMNLDDEDDDDNDPENVILDIDENTDLLTNFDSRIPQYKKNRVVGNNSISEVTGHLCKLCDRFFINEQRAQMHGKTKQHYDKFVALLKEKHAEKTKDEENKAKKHNIDENAEDDEGNWKRRKISAEEDGDETQKETNEVKKEDLYDPMEAEEEAEAEEKQQKEEEEKLKNEAVTEEKIENGDAEEPEKETDDKVEEVKEKEKETPKEEVTPVKQEPETTPQRGTRNSRGRPRPGPASKTRGRNN